MYYKKWASSIVFLISVAVVTATFQSWDPNGNSRVDNSQRRVRHDTRLSNNSTAKHCPPCGTADLAERVSRLETQLVGRLSQLDANIAETNKKLDSSEWQSDAIRSSLLELNTKFDQFTSNNPATDNNNSDQMSQNVDNISRGLDLSIAALRELRNDIKSIKQNFSEITDRPSFISSRFNDEITASTVKKLPESCKEVQERGNSVSGIYRIQPELAPQAFMVLCDMETRGGGWTFIHNRYSGMQNFYLNWESYKLGFGNLGGEFWLGLEYMHQLTSSKVNELLIELVALEMSQSFAHFAAFSIGSEAEGYPIKVLARYNGTAGDSLMYHAGSKFTTKDLDQDEWIEGNCAQTHLGAWWYKSCDSSNLNGRYIATEEYQGMYWKSFSGSNTSLLQARMMVRPREDS